MGSAIGQVLPLAIGVSLDELRARMAHDNATIMAVICCDGTAGL